MNLKNLLGVLSALTALAILPSQASAQTIQLCPQASEFRALCNLKPENFADLVRLGIIGLLIVASVLAIFFLIFGGIKWILSGGDKAGVESARNMIVAAIIGLIIAFLSFLILIVVGNFFGISLLQINLNQFRITGATP